MRGNETAKMRPIKASPYLNLQLAAVAGGLLPILSHRVTHFFSAPGWLQNEFKSLPANPGVEEYILIS